MTMVYRRALAMLAAVALVCGLGAASAGMTVRAETAADIRQQLSKLEQEEKTLSQKVNTARQNLADKQKYKDTLDRQVKNLTDQITLLNGQIHTLNSQITDQNDAIREDEQAIAQRQEAIDKRFQQLRQRLRAIAKNGQFSKLQMLLDTSSYADYLMKQKMMERISKNDQERMDALDHEIQDIHRQKDALEAKRDDLTSRKEEVVALKKQADAKKGKLEAAYKEIRYVVNELEKDIRYLNQSIAQTKKEQDALDQKLAELNKKPSEAGTYQEGTMFWPVPTIRYMNDGFGIRWGRLHKGIDISGHPTILVHGQNIVAAADGVVTYANSTDRNGGGYGYHIVVDHGYDAQNRRITTLYAHCSQVNVKVGQRVTGGKTVLGKVGNTGNVYGSHLHFEVRRNNVPVDPIANGYVRVR